MTEGQRASSQTAPGGQLGGRSRDRELAELRFALRVADALVGNVDLARVLARVAGIAAPELASWAGVSVWERAGVRQASRGPGQLSSEGVVELRESELPARLRKMGEQGATRLRLAEESALIELGASKEAAAELLSSAPVEIELRPLFVEGEAVALLALAMAPERGAIVETYLSSLCDRAGPALAAAHIFEERSTLAATLRASLLPAPLPKIDGVRLGASYRPAEEAALIGGDFYDVQPEDEEDAWSVSVGDVCGKGVEAAVLTGQARQSLRTAALSSEDPGERLRLLNETLRRSDGRSYLTLLHATMRKTADGLSLRLASGGHPPPLVLRKDGGLERVDVKGMLIGMLSSYSAPTASLFLSTGDTLVCFTDGLLEAEGESGRLGQEALERVLPECCGLDPQAITEAMLDLALGHLAGRPHDDIAVLAIQRAEE